METQARRAKELAKRLETHPELMEEVEGLLEEVDDNARKLVTADEAETAVVGRMRSLGRKALGSWAAKRSDELCRERHSGQRAESKKNSAGIRPAAR